MSSTFVIIDRLKKQLENLKPLKPEYQKKLDKKFRLEFNYNSNHLEGNTLTFGETELLLIFDDTKGKHTLREYEEMKSHDVAYLLVEVWAKDEESPLIEQKIKNLNEIILVRPFWKEAITPDGQNTRRLINIGNYKEHPNSVRLANGEIFEYTSPTDTPFEMQELLKWYREEEDIHPVTLAAMLHYKFVRIHPFDDGNGRVSRLLMNYVLLKYDYPPIIIKSEDKHNYLRVLNLADVGDFEPFIEYIAKHVVWSLELSIKAANGEDLDEAGDLEKKLSVLKKKLKQEKEVRLKYSFDVFNSLTSNVIDPLLETWFNKIKQFDSLFLSSSFLMRVDNEETEGSLILNDILEQFVVAYQHMEYHNYLPNSIKFKSHFKRLINSSIMQNFDGGGFYFEFHQNAYVISFSGSQETISKLYDEELTEEEMKIIVDSIGNWFYAQIEKAIEVE